MVNGDENCAVPLAVAIDLCFYLVSILLKYFDWLHTLISHFNATMRICTEDQNLAPKRWQVLYYTFNTFNSR